MTEYANDYTIDELAIACMARELRGEILAGGATNCTMLAVMLAKRTHAPELGLVGAGAFLDSEIVASLSHYYRQAMGTAAAQVDSLELFDVVFGGKWAIWIIPAQLDRCGNANISCIGDWRRPSTALVGARGLPDNTTNEVMVGYFVANHSKRVFNERVDFVGGLGWGERRRKAGTPAGGPRLVVSNLGTFDFDEQSGEMQVRSLHPGVSLDQVQAATGFPLSGRSTIPVTEPPSVEEVRLLREELDPLGLRRIEFVSGQEAGRIWAAARAGEANLFGQA